jgi:predicted TIM-barrel fold metal-dependent hydrolase
MVAVAPCDRSTFASGQELAMNINFTRREFVRSLPLLSFAAKAAVAGQTVKPAYPIIDTHIHIFDKTRVEGAPYPRDMPNGGEPPQGMIALPNRFKAIVSPFGVVGAVIVEASPRLEDNFWLLDVAKDHPIIVGLVGRVDLADAAFPNNLDRLVQNKLFLGIRQGQLHLGLERPEYLANLKRLADADCSLDVDIPSQGITAPEVLVRVLDKVPSLRLVVDHLPGVTYRLKEYSDRTAMQRYGDYLRELAKRPQVYTKLSEVVRTYDGKVSTDLSLYRDWLDELWSIFGEDRIVFGSDWPQSESLEFNSYPNVIGVARAYVMSKGPVAMEKVFWRNSMKPYRWVQRDSIQRRTASVGSLRSTPGTL